MQTYNLSEYTAGDTWKGIPEITIVRDGTSLDLTDASEVVALRVTTPVTGPTTLTADFVLEGYLI
jgi:hypothetical protein